MIIRSLRLAKYKRLRLQDIKLFEIHFTEIYQLIIGTNGSGKSSILRELTPMPANHKDYEKNGFKEIVLTHRGNVYWLISNFEHGNNHAFFVGPDTGNYDLATRDDLVDLNEGHTARAQKALVEQHFDLTQDILDVLLGDVKFTTMSPLKRRDWILNLAGGDLEYAIDVHRKLNNLVNEQTAIVKHTQRRISEEQMKMISEEEYTELNRRVTAYKEALDALYQIPLIPEIGIPDQYKQRAQRAMQEVETITAEFFRIRMRQPQWFEFDGRQLDLDANIAHAEHYMNNELHGQITTKEAMLNDLYQQSNNLVQNLKKLESMYSGDINGLIALRDQEAETINQYIQQSNWFVRYVPINDQDVIMTWPGIYKELNDIFSSIDDNSQRQITRKTRDHAITRVDVLRREIDNDRAYRVKLEHQLEHLRTAKHETCPNCKHQWIPGAENYLSESNLMMELEKVVQLINKNEADVKELLAFLDRCQEYNAWLTRFSAVVRNNPQHRLLWDKMVIEEVYFQAPFKSLTAINLYNDDIERSKEIYPRIIENDSRTTIIQQTQELKDSKAEVSETLLSETNAKIEVLISEIQELKTLTFEFTEWLADIRHAKQLREQAEKQLQIACSELITYWEAEAARVVTTERQDYQLKLSNTSAALQEANNILNIINSLNENLSTEKTRLEQCRILADNLSPKNGLIAECIRGIIEELTTQMNNIIAEIWSYPLHILPCADESDDSISSDLKYRFPLSIENGTNVTEDVAKGSSAQRDVVDFAFLLCVYMYKDLDGYPLYLDELAPTMDELHRMQILQLVKLLIETKRNSQMFMISHYVSGHGAFTTAEICMLNDRNILNKPKDYNGHVKIK